jgi:hypothetical protein
MNNLLETVKVVLSTTTTRWLSLIESLPEDLLSQPFILGSGPWHPYFQDHDVSK